MTPDQFFPLAIQAARAGGHIFPAYAACEAAEESAWGASQLCLRANNLFGQKAPLNPPADWAYPVLSLPTHEWNAAAGRLEPATADWPIFPDWATSFRERFALLNRLSYRYSNYAMALAATTGEQFVICVSKTWASDPQRGDNVLAIYAQHQALLESLDAV